MGKQCSCNKATQPSQSKNEDYLFCSKKAKTDEINKNFVSHGGGHCKEGYYAGFGANEKSSLDACLALCHSESKCDFVSFKRGEACSRYNTDTCTLVSAA